MDEIYQTVCRVYDFAKLYCLDCKVIYIIFVDIDNNMIVLYYAIINLAYSKFHL